MSAPSWLRWTLAAAMIAVALFHLARLAIARLTRRRVAIDVELTHAAMGAVMTMMLVGPLAPSDGRRLAVLFAVSTLWFVWRGLHSYVVEGPRAMAVPVRHVVGCAAMVYMLSAVSVMAPRMSGMPPAAVLVTSPALGAALVLATVGVAGWTAAQLRPRAHSPTILPTVTAGCQLAVHVTTVYMLLAI